MTELLSRAGKSSSQRFKILQDQLSILKHDVPKLAVSPLLPLPGPKQATRREEVEKLIDKELEQLQKSPRKVSKPPPSHPSAAFKAQNRDDFYRTTVRDMQVSKDQVPPCGHYNVSYAQVDGQRTSLTWQFQPRPVSKSSPPPPATERLKEEPWKPPKRSPMSLQLPHQPPRAPYNPHDRRFESVNLMPGILSKYHKASGVNMARGIERPDFLHVRVGPEYTANPEVLMTDLGRAPSFSTMRNRASLFAEVSRPEYTLPTEVKRTGIDFSKASPRNSDPRSLLPSFMQGNSNRLALASLSEKSLRLTCDRHSTLSPGLSVMDYLRTLHAQMHRTHKQHS